MKPRLLVLSGPLKDSTIPLAEGEITIGREASNGLAVIDPSVSRKHCAVRGQEGRFQVRDLDSRNGTLVNGNVIEEQWLQHGDEIAAGDSSFLFLVEEEDVAVAGRVEFEDGKRTAETTMIREEKTGYEDKIKKLEEEVLRLQEEVRYFLLYMCSLLMLPSKVGEEASDELYRSLIFYAPTASAAPTSTALTSTPCTPTDTYNPCGRRAILR